MAVDSAALDKLIRESGVSFRENGTSFMFECPRCQKKDRLAMYKASGWFVCYYCRSSGFKGRPEFALTELLGMPLVDIRKRIYGTDIPTNLSLLNVQLDDYWGENEEEMPAPELQVNLPETLWPPDAVGLEAPRTFVKGARYLHGRGITPALVEAYDIRYSPVDKRVLFPVKVDGRLIGWQARYIGQTERWDEEQERLIRIPKIITSDSLVGKGQRWLMFQDRLKGSEHCVLTEGPVTAIKAHLCGGNVASMGKDVSAFQLDFIRRNVRKLYLALDSDAGEAITRITYDLYDDLEVYTMNVPQNWEWYDDPNNEKDLGDLECAEVFELFKSAQRVPRGRMYISVGGILSY